MGETEGHPRLNRLRQTAITEPAFRQEALDNLDNLDNLNDVLQEREPDLNNEEMTIVRDFVRDFRSEGGANMSDQDIVQFIRDVLPRKRPDGPQAQRYY
jgi:hypothetical protein